MLAFNPSSQPSPSGEADTCVDTYAPKEKEFFDFFRDSLIIRNGKENPKLREPQFCNQKSLCLPY